MFNAMGNLINIVDHAPIMKIMSMI